MRSQFGRTNNVGATGEELRSTLYNGGSVGGADVAAKPRASAPRRGGPLANGRSNYGAAAHHHHGFGAKPPGGAGAPARGSSSFMACGHNGAAGGRAAGPAKGLAKDRGASEPGPGSRASSAASSKDRGAADGAPPSVPRTSSTLSRATLASAAKGREPAAAADNGAARTPTNHHHHHLHNREGPGDEHKIAGHAAGDREGPHKENGASHRQASSAADRSMVAATATHAGTSSASSASQPEAPAPATATMTPPAPHGELRGCAPAENYILRQWMKGPSSPDGVVVNVSDRPSLCMSVRGSEACIGSSDHALYIVDCQSCTFVRALYGKQYGHTEWVTCCDYLPDGRILSGGMDGKLCLWDKKGVRSVDLKGHSASISAVKAGAEGSLAVSASYDKTLMLWNVSRLQTKAAGCLKAHKGAVLGFCLSSQGSIVSGSRDGEVILWDAARAAPLLHVNNAHEGHVTAVECVEDTKHKAWEESRELFLTGGQDGILQVWDFRTRGPVHTLPLHRNAVGKGAVSSIAISYTATGSGPIVVTAGADNTLKVTEPRKGFEVLHTLSSHRDFIYSLYVSGPLAWSGGGDGSLLVHELLTGQCLYGLGADAKGAVRCISLAGPDRLVVAGDDGNVMIYSL